MPGSLVRTLRIRTRRKVGNLGILATALGDAGAQVGEIVTAKIGHRYTLRDFHIVFDDEEHLEHALGAVSELADSEVVEVRNDVTFAHRGGKVRTVSRVPLSDISSLHTSVTPGAREIADMIDDDVRAATLYTSIPRTVGILSDGAGLIGTGKVRPQAMMPLLEAQAALLSEKAGLSALPISVDVTSEEDLVETIVRIAPSFGGIHLSALAAPRNMRIKEKLEERLQIPVFDDDADAPAVTALAATINICRRTGRDIRKTTIGQLGLGTAGGAIAALIMKYTGQPVVGEDVHPAAMSRHLYLGGKNASLEDIMATCDVVIANTGHGGLIPAQIVREGQAILALSEPRPEITAYDASLAGAAFAADGKAVDKAVAVPGVFLGAMAVGANCINSDMLIAAAVTLADLADKEDLVPTPIDDEVHPHVAAAVARAAVETEVARRTSDTPLSAEVFAEIIADIRQLPL